MLREGRHAAGKDRSIKRIVKYLSPRETRVAALRKPFDREIRSWYFQRNVAQLPVAGELVLFNRSWYNRAGVEQVIELSRATLRKMHQNLWWAVGCNVIAFPLAAGVLYLLTLSPEIAAPSMSGTSALLAINALMLKRTKLAGIKSAKPKTSRAAAASAPAGAPA